MCLLKYFRKGFAGNFSYVAARKQFAKNSLGVHFWVFLAAAAALKQPIPFFASQKEGIGREGIGREGIGREGIRREGIGI